LMPLLENGDFQSLEYAEKLQGVESMKKLLELIDDYDFAGAYELVRQILKQ